MIEVIKSRIKLFLSERHMEVFVEILRNIKEIIIMDKNNKIETLFNKYYKDNQIKNSMEENIQNYFIKIKNSIFEKEKFLNYKFSKLEISYLKNKAKLIRQKCNLIAIQYKKKTDYIIEYYIKICRKELQKIKDEEKEEKEREKYGKFYRKRKSIKTEENEIDDLEKQGKMINLFIGNFDFTKGKKIEIIKVKRSDFVNAYLFKSVDDNNYDIKLQTFNSPENHEKKKKFHFKKNKFKGFSQNSKFKFFKNNQKFNLYNNYNNFNKKNNYHTVNISNKTIFTNYSSIENNKKINKNHINLKLSIQKKVTNSIYSTNQKTIDSFLPKIKSFSYRNSDLNIQSNNKNKKYYFSREDLYY